MPTVAPVQLDKLSPELWRRVSKLFDDVIDLPETERIPFVRTLWATEPDVARELMAMLVAAAEVERTKAVGSEPFNAMLSEALAEKQSAFAAGHRFGAWTLDRCLGKGGMGEVWRARRADGLYQAEAAIKFLRTDAIANQRALVARFARERAVLARLNHPNIARLLDAGVHEGTAYLVLELIDGRPLLEHIRETRPGLAERVRMVREIALAVEHAHNQFVLHRDLKPSNVLVTRDGQTKLLDFGVAGLIERPEEEPHTKLTQLTGRALTLEYASPEQVAGDTTTPASDVYSLGVLLFHLATGNRPFAEHTSRAALEYALLNSDPPVPSQSIARSERARQVVDHLPPPEDARRLAGDLDEIIGRAMQLAPEKRYPTAAAFAADLTAWLEHRPTSFRRHDRMHRMRLWLDRHAGLAAAAAAVSVAVLGVMIWLGFTALAQRQALQAERQTAEVLARTIREIEAADQLTDPAARADAVARARAVLRAHPSAQRLLDPPSQR
jgi:serine/threonine-protein kinase